MSLSQDLPHHCFTPSLLQPSRNQGKSSPGGPHTTTASTTTTHMLTWALRAAASGPAAADWTCCCCCPADPLADATGRAAAAPEPLVLGPPEADATLPPIAPPDADAIRSPTSFLIFRPPAAAKATALSEGGACVPPVGADDPGSADVGLRAGCPTPRGPARRAHSTPEGHQAETSEKRCATDVCVAAKPDTALAAAPPRARQHHCWAHQNDYCQIITASQRRSCHSAHQYVAPGAPAEPPPGAAE